jgi:hypothetical protein
MNFKWKKYWEKIRSADYAGWFFSFLGKKSRWIIFLSFLSIVAFCGYIWYSYIYNPGWSSGQKKAYMDTKEKGITLDKSKFDSVVSYQENRKAEYEKKLENLEDIFRLGERKVK